jgi:hypothetical protein
MVYLHRAIPIALSLILVIGAAPAMAQGQSAQAAGGDLTASEKSLITVLRPTDHALYQQVIDTFRAQGRFDYVPIDVLGEGATGLLEDFRKYLNANAAALASKGDKPDFKFKDVVITGEKLHKVFASAYVMVPRWTWGAVSVSDEVKKIDENGNDTRTVVVSAPLTLTVDFINVKSSDSLPALKGVGAAAKTISVTLYKSDSEKTKGAKLAKYEGEKRDAASLRAEQLPATGEAAIAQVMKDARSLDAFRQRSYIKADKDKTLMMVSTAGGVEYDSTFLVKRKIKGGSLQDVGFVKVRDILPSLSPYQTIQDSVGFEEGDILDEHPQSGIDTGLRLGMATFDTQGGNGLAPSLMISTDKNLAAQFKNPMLSETYGTADINLLLPLSSLSSILSTPTVGAHALLGLKKRFYLGQFVLAPALKGGIVASAANVGTTVSGQRANDGSTLIPAGSSINVLGYAFGGGPVLGAEWQFNPDLKFGAEAGFILSTAVTPFKVTVIDKDDSKNSYDFKLSQLTGPIPPNANAFGPLFSLGGSYSF